MDRHVYDVVILGGGLAGGSMAFALSGLGWDTVLIDRSAFPRHKVCGEFLSPEAQGILAALGLDTLVRSLAPSEMNAARLTAASGATIAVPLPGTALGVSRYALDSALHEAAQANGAEVRTGVTVTSVSAIGSGGAGEGEGYRIETRDKQGKAALEARVVIGAWGRSAGVGLIGTDADADADAGAGKSRKSSGSFIGVKSHYAEMQPPEGEPAVELYFFPGGYVGLAPIEAGRLNAAALVTPGAFQRAGRTVQGVFGDAAVHNAAFRRRLARAAPVPGTQAATAPVAPHRAPSAWGAVAHIGDAAAVIPPLCGDGMAMALRSVALCAPLAHGCLAGCLSPSEWRRRYTDALRREFAGPLRWGGLLQDVLIHPHLSPWAFRLGVLLPGLAQRFVRATRLHVVHRSMQ